MQSIKGRGTAANPASRFVPLTVIRDEDAYGGEDDPAPTTQFFHDASKSIIATNDSPDVGFEASINPYRGCEHGCIYCFARPTHEYLDMSAGLDFESKIMVKPNAPELLRRELANPKWQPKPLQISGVTDCYQPVERRLRLTRRCLEVLCEFRNPVTILTKSYLVTRDIDLFKELAAHQAIVVMLSVGTIDSELARRMEPRASVPSRRLEAVAALAAAGIPVGVMVAPIIPGLNDHEIPSVLEAVAAAGAVFAGHTMLRLPFGLAALFEDWLAQHYPDRKKKVLNRVRSMRGGKLNDPNFGARMRGDGIWAEQISMVFKLTKQRLGLDRPFPQISTAAFRRPGGSQLALW